MMRACTYYLLKYEVTKKYHSSLLLYELQITLVPFLYIQSNYKNNNIIMYIYYKLYTYLPVNPKDLPLSGIVMDVEADVEP